MLNKFESGPKFNTEKENNLNLEHAHEREITKEEVERLEKSEMAIDNKINFLLTKSGLKPASEILLVIKTWHDEGLTEHMSEEEIQESLSIIQESGLPYHLKDREIIEEPYMKKKEPDVERFYEREQMKIIIGRSKEDLDFLERARESKSDEMLGKAYGFPPTAIEAFVGKRKRLNRRSLPLEIRHSDGIIFSSPTLSQDNWQEEIKYGQRCGEFIKRITPKLYEEMKIMALKNL